MPRTIIDVPAEQLRGLDRLREQRHATRAALIRDAIAKYLSEHHADLSKEAFGIWRKRPVDALAYEDAIRSEWKS